MNTLQRTALSSLVLAAVAMATSASASPASSTAPAPVLSGVPHSLSPYAAYDPIKGELDLMATAGPGAGRANVATVSAAKMPPQLAPVQSKSKGSTHNTAAQLLGVAIRSSNPLATTFSLTEAEAQAGISVDAVPINAKQDPVASLVQAYPGTPEPTPAAQPAQQITLTPLDLIASDLNDMESAIYALDDADLLGRFKNRGFKRIVLIPAAKDAANIDAARFFVL